MLPVVESHRSTATQMTVYSVVVWALTLLFWVVADMGWIYLGTALLVSGCCSPVGRCGSGPRPTPKQAARDGHPVLRTSRSPTSRCCSPPWPSISSCAGEHDSFDFRARSRLQYCPQKFRNAPCRPRRPAATSQIHPSSSWSRVWSDPGTVRPDQRFDRWHWLKLTRRHTPPLRPPTTRAAARQSKPSRWTVLLGTGDHKVDRPAVHRRRGRRSGRRPRSWPWWPSFYAGNFDSTWPPTVSTTCPRSGRWGVTWPSSAAWCPSLVGLAVYLVPLQVGASSRWPSPGGPPPPCGPGSSASTSSDPGLHLQRRARRRPAGLRRPVGRRAGHDDRRPAIWALVCIAATVLGASTQGMTLDRVPLTSWSLSWCSPWSGCSACPIVMAELLLAFLRVRYFHLAITDSAQLTGVMPTAWPWPPPSTGSPSPCWAWPPTSSGSTPSRPIRLFTSPVLGAIGAFGMLTFGADVVGMASLRPVDFDNAFLVVGLPLPSCRCWPPWPWRRRQHPHRHVHPPGGAGRGPPLRPAPAAARHGRGPILGLVEPVMGFLDELFPDSIDMTNTLILNGTRFHEGIRALVIGAVLVSVLIAALHHWSVKIWGRRLAEPLGLYLADPGQRPAGPSCSPSARSRPASTTSPGCRPGPTDDFNLRPGHHLAGRRPRSGRRRRHPAGQPGHELVGWGPSRPGPARPPGPAPPWSGPPPPRRSPGNFPGPPDREFAVRPWPTVSCAMPGPATAQPRPTLTPGPNAGAGEPDAADGGEA